MPPPVLRLKLPAQVEPRRRVDVHDRHIAGRIGIPRHADRRPFAVHRRSRKSLADLAIVQRQPRRSKRWRKRDIRHLPRRRPRIAGVAINHGSRFMAAAGDRQTHRNRTQKRQRQPNCSKSTCRTSGKQPHSKPPRSTGTQAERSLRQPLIVRVTSLLVGRRWSKKRGQPVREQCGARGNGS